MMHYELFRNFVAQKRKIVIYETIITIFFDVDSAVVCH